MSTEQNDHASSNRKWSKYADVYDPIKVGSIDGTDIIPHDKAVVRAINSEYKPNKYVKGKPENTIFIARLNPRTTEDTVKQELEKFGKILRCRLVKDIVTGKSKCYAFVEFELKDSAQKAYFGMHKEFIDNAQVLVDWEHERLMEGWKPRRLGGGFGGKKETGQLRFGCRERPFAVPFYVKADTDQKRGSHSRMVRQW